MKVRYLIALTAALSVSATAFAANDGEALFKKSGCNICHTVNKKNVGPALTEIAAKYAGDSTAQAKLVQKVRMGGAGSFGKVPMPAAAKGVSDDSIKAIVAWALTQK
jgi:cytochrome c